MNYMTKLFTGIGSVTASIHNGIEAISTSSLKSGVDSIKDTTVKYGSAVAQGYVSNRKPKQLELDLKAKS
jgi:hypothetical protein